MALVEQIKTMVNYYSLDKDNAGDCRNQWAGNFGWWFTRSLYQIT